MGYPQHRLPNYGFNAFSEWHWWHFLDPEVYWEVQKGGVTRGASNRSAKKAGGKTTGWQGLVLTTQGAAYGHGGFEL